MARNIKDKELIADAKLENKEYVISNPGQDTENAPAPQRSENISQPNLKNANTEEKNNQTTNFTIANPEPEKDDFKEKFDDFFKGMDNLIAGSVIINMVDDFKTNLLYIYAKKNGVDIPKSALAMDDKSKMFCSFLIDYAVKNKLFDTIKKHPLIAAAGVVALSTGSTYLMLSTMKGKNEELENLKKKNAELQAQVDLQATNERKD